MICDGGMMGGMWFAGLFWLVLVAGGIFLVVWAVGRGTRTGGSAANTHEDRPLAILRERLARGEISDTEYRDLRRTLNE